MPSGSWNRNCDWVRDWNEARCLATIRCGRSPHTSAASVTPLHSQWKSELCIPCSASLPGKGFHFFLPAEDTVSSGRCPHPSMPRQWAVDKWTIQPCDCLCHSCGHQCSSHTQHTITITQTYCTHAHMHTFMHNTHACTHMHAHTQTLS